MKKIILAFAVTLLLVSGALADTIYLRDGRVVRGTVLGFINGRIVVKITSVSSTGATTTSSTSPDPRAGEEPGDVRFYRPAEIDRIEIEGRSLDEARFVVRTVQVALGPNWIDSGVDVKRGQLVQVRATGTIYAGRARITPDGLRSPDPNAPLPRAAEGILIGAVGNDSDSPIVELGSSHDFTADRDGRLYLTANRGSYTDARGAYTVEVRTERQLPQRRSDTASNRNDQPDDANDPFATDDRRSTPAAVRPRNPNDRAPSDPYNRNPAPRDVSINVLGTSRGTDTGIDLRTGDRVAISATGRIVAGRRAGEVGPEGGNATGVGAVFGTRPMPNAGVGALIGYIRLSDGQVSQPFFVGTQLNFSSPADGRLILLVNDDNYGDNSGSFNVRVVVN
ncbi:MAG: hypothetical protein QOF61_1252 [Acidobacteriota bacterium]|jgi:hypothetical protein|nr:hypothetical protein [Acidobacteriota bacterium]